MQVRAALGFAVTVSQALREAQLEHEGTCSTRVLTRPVQILSDSSRDAFIRALKCEQLS